MKLFATVVLLAIGEVSAFKALPLVPQQVALVRRELRRTTVSTGSVLPASSSLLNAGVDLGKSALAALGSPPASSTLSKGLAVNSALFSALMIKGQHMLTLSGVFHAWILGTTLWTTLGWQGWSLCVLYLLAGSMVTKVKMKEKSKLGISEGRGGRRGPENVWGSAATGALCALASQRWPAQRSLLTLGFVASMATKLSDTFQSEIGKAFGKRCFLITSLKPVPRGTEGAVSLEGYLAGIVGSLIIAAFGLMVRLINVQRSVPTFVSRSE
jgi:uncharacterized protein (TIGR00297 family)